MANRSSNPEAEGSNPWEKHPPLFLTTSTKNPRVGENAILHIRNHEISGGSEAGDEIHFFVYAHGRSEFIQSTIPFVWGSIQKRLLIPFRILKSLILPASSSTVLTFDFRVDESMSPGFIAVIWQKSSAANGGGIRTARFKEDLKLA